jgi:hypothetical protein
MAILYCFGVPVASWYALRTKKRDIQKLQRIFVRIAEIEKLKGEMKRKNAKTKDNLTAQAEEKLKRDPILSGLSPLYKDYEPKYWWFEIPKFVSTLILCGLVTLIPAEGASQVFLSLAVSIGMMVLFGNCNPYSNEGDDLLAQFCQISLTLAMAVGLLEKASESFQVIHVILCKSSYI